MGLKAGQFIHNDRIKIPWSIFCQPHQVFPVDDIHTGSFLKSCSALSCTAKYPDSGKAGKMLPLFNFLFPDRLRHTLRSDDQHTPTIKRVQDQFPQCRQGYHSFSHPTIQHQAANWMFQDKLCGVSLIVMCIVFHPESLQSFRCNPNNRLETPEPGAAWPGTPVEVSSFSQEPLLPQKPAFHQGTTPSGPAPHPNRETRTLQPIHPGVLPQFSAFPLPLIPSPGSSFLEQGNERNIKSLYTRVYTHTLFLLSINNLKIAFYTFDVPPVPCSGGTMALCLP